MAGGHLKHRHLNRSSSHRQALLRNLLTSLFTHESICTTYPKAKETQRLADKLITLAKRNSAASRRRAESIFYTPIPLTNKLFGPLRERYLARPGGYTRVLRVEPLKDDQAPSAILELVDGPRDMRFALTAAVVARERAAAAAVAGAGADAGGREEAGEGAAAGLKDRTVRNIRKVTRYRPNGEEELERLVGKLERMGV
ncbi:hypothetical protein FGG08_007503 [Glutinoglossum americanum]|uniref:Large ribosomal subunit protein bL17m n=1 Tax=Glutinoglossum americanum TaxID=1670608 RepID=A0A9P8KZ91_9PEZI|nr:hypothetical protein FGG08_007503 [Glutinoglossum americanum]